jgi:hypothetical protein
MITKMADRETAFFVYSPAVQTFMLIPAGETSKKGSLLYAKRSHLGADEEICHPRF